MKTKIFVQNHIDSLSTLNRLLKGKDYKGARFFIVLDENTYYHCLPKLISHVSALENAAFLEVPVGEDAKSIDVASQLWQSLLESDADRQSVIINLGGGCVSDLGGFVAAGFKRGIRYINVPTTLVAMVDAAIGGKTAVNLGTCKNQVGFFHQPDAVIIDPPFFLTTSDGDRISGFFEILKTLLLSDAAQLRFFEDYLIAKTADNQELLWYSVIKHCAEFKQAVVNADHTEKSVRKILNLGHTFGHGYESFMMQTGRHVEHGIAVGVGLICELYLSVKKLGMDEHVLTDYLKTVKSLIKFPTIALKDTEIILSYMRQDKKNRDGLILCTLLKDVGVPVIDVAIDENEVRDALLQACKL